MIIITQQCIVNFGLAPAFGLLMKSYGWRDASGLGVVLNFAFVPVFAMLLFHTPESVGHRRERRHSHPLRDTPPMATIPKRPHLP